MLTRKDWDDISKLKFRDLGNTKIVNVKVWDETALIEINDTKIMMSKAIESNDDIVYSLFNPEITNA